MSIFDLGLKIFPLKFQIFKFFPLGSQKFSSGWVTKNSGQRQVSFLFSAGQKYAWDKHFKANFLAILCANRYNQALFYKIEKRSS